MKIRIMTVAGLVFMLASAVGAQTKFTGTVHCAKPDPNYSIEVGDHPGHALTLEKDSCTWGADTLINGLKITTDLEATPPAALRAATRAVHSRR